jgi:hypothetical protein
MPDATRIAAPDLTISPGFPHKPTMIFNFLLAVSDVTVLPRSTPHRAARSCVKIVRVKGGAGIACAIGNPRNRAAMSFTAQSQKDLAAGK